jgi:hypothetical protein
MADFFGLDRACPDPGSPALAGGHPGGSKAGPLTSQEAAMVVITPSTNGSDNEVHVFCSLDFFGEDVPIDQAERIAAEHEGSDQHIDAEVNEMVLEQAMERRSNERGY